jgi:hypothetical protein
MDLEERETPTRGPLEHLLMIKLNWERLVFYNLERVIIIIMFMGVVQKFRWEIHRGLRWTIASYSQVYTGH